MPLIYQSGHWSKPALVPVVTTPAATIVSQAITLALPYRNMAVAQAVIPQVEITA